MEPGQPSRTALGAAIHRAAHQVLEGGRLWEDPLAVRILGPSGEALARDAGTRPAQLGLRHFIVLRARFAEEALAAAHALGVRQGVVLGAGLDTYAYRTPLGDGLRLFEVDHAATQAWKRRRLAEAGIPEPEHLAFVPVDFEQEALVGCLARAGFDPDRPAFCSWLGVVPYLTETAIFATLADLAALAGGVRIAFDYGNPPEPGAAGEGGVHADLARRVAGAGEPLRTTFATDRLHAQLRGLGFQVLEDLGPADLRARYGSKDGQGHPLPSDRGGHLLLAATELTR